MVTKMMDLLESQVKELEEFFGLPKERPIWVDLKIAVQRYQSLSSEEQGQIIEIHDRILSQNALLVEGMAGYSEESTEEEMELTRRLWLLTQRLPRLNAAVLCGIHNDPDPAVWFNQ